MKMIWILVSTVFFMSCNQSEKGKTVTSLVKKDVQKPDDATNEVMLSVQPDILELSALADTLDIKMTNYTSDTVTTGLHYRVWFFENNQWTTITPKDMVFNDIGYSLRPMDSKDFVIRLFKEKTHYQVGKYRVIKYFLASDYAKTKESHEVYVEFKVR